MHTIHIVHCYSVSFGTFNILFNCYSTMTIVVMSGDILPILEADMV